MLPKLFNPANDDGPTDAWLEFYENKELYKFAQKSFSDIAVGLKNRGAFLTDDVKAERSASNFVWFVKFEKSFRYTEAREIQKPPSLEIV